MLIGVLADNEDLANLYSTNLLLEGHDCHVFSHPLYFVRDVIAHHYDAVIYDHTMPGKQYGVEVIEEIRESRPTLPLLVVSGIALAEISEAEQHFDHVRVLQKTLSIKQIIEIAVELAKRERIAKLGQFVISSSR